MPDDWSWKLRAHSLNHKQEAEGTECVHSFGDENEQDVGHLKNFTPQKTKDKLQCSKREHGDIPRRLGTPSLLRTSNDEVRIPLDRQLPNNDMETSY